MSEKYTVDVKCHNCKKWHWIKIPVGMSIEEFGREENKLCEYCGCSVINRNMGSRLHSEVQL